MLIGQSVHQHCVQPKDTPTRSDEAPVSAVENDGGRTEAERDEVLLTAEEQLVQDILDKGKNKKSVRIRKCYYKPLYKQYNINMHFILTTIVCLLIGHICKQYKIGCKMGEGGCGSVYEGTRCKDGLKVYIFFT